MEKELGTCLVTGCAGFVGSHLVDALLERGYRVIGVDNFASGKQANMDLFYQHDNFVFIEEDISGDNVVSRLFADYPSIDIVFHLAAVVSVPYSIAHPQETMRVNWQASKSLHEAALASSKCKTMVFAGSAAEYGDADSLPLAEEDVVAEERLPSPYGVAKQRSSLLIEKSGFGSSLRFFNIYGPRQDPSSPYSGVISRFISLALEGQNLTVNGDGGQTRDFVSVHDCVQAYLLVAGVLPEHPEPASGVFNVGTGKSCSVQELAELVISVCDADVSVQNGPEREGDIRHSVADITRLEKEGYKVKVAFREGLEETVRWYASS